MRVLDENILVQPVDFPREYLSDKTAQVAETKQMKNRNIISIG